MKALVLQAETHGTETLIPGLQNLLKQHTPEQRTRSPAPARAAKVQPEKKPPQTFPNEFRLNTKWWKGTLVSVAKLAAALDEAETPGGDVAITTVAKAQELRAVAKVHGYGLKFALVCRDVSTSDKAQEAECKLHWMQSSHGRWQQLGVLPLVDQAGLPEWGTLPCVVKDTDGLPAVAPLTSCRVCMPKELLAPEAWSLAQKKPVRVLETALPAGVTFRSYGWHCVTGSKTGKDECICGFVKLPKEAVASVLSRSGARGVFFQEMLPKDAPRLSGQVSWLPNTFKTAFEYLKAARAEADVAKTGLAFRKGGGACLGLIGVPPKNPADAEVRKRWVARAVPMTWTPSRFQEVLTKHNWRVIAEVQPPAKGGGNWTFRGVCPQGASEGLVLDFGAAKPVVISPWRPAKRAAPTAPLRAPKQGWVTVSEVDAVPCDLPKTMEVDEEPTKQLDKADTKKRGSSVDSVESSKDNKAARTEGFLGPEKTPVWDCGGDGDCGFRVLAAQNAIRNRADVSKIMAKIPQLALSLRTKAVHELQADSEWREAWLLDAECTTVTEAGPIPKSPDEYIEACKRPRKWLDPWLCQATAKVLKTDVLVFKFLPKYGWKFIERVFVERGKPRKNPMVLFLKDGHFVTLDHQHGLPDEWQNYGLDRKEKATLCASFLGGTKGNKRAASVVSSTLSDLLRPVPQPRVSSGSPGQTLSPRPQTPSGPRLSTRAALDCESQFSWLSKVVPGNSAGDTWERRPKIGTPVRNLGQRPGISSGPEPSTGENFGSESTSPRPLKALAGNSARYGEPSSKIGTPVRNFGLRPEIPDDPKPSTGEEFESESKSPWPPEAVAGNSVGYGEPRSKIGTPVRNFGHRPEIPMIPNPAQVRSLKASPSHLGLRKLWLATQ